MSTFCTDNLVTVVIPTYNRLWSLKQSILSIQKQTYENWRLLVVDDAGNDPIEDYIKSLNDSRMEYFRQNKNVGVAANWKSGIEKIKTKYFSILMDDDWYGPCFLKNRIDVFSKYPNVSMVYGPYNRVMSKERVIAQIRTKKTGFLNNEDLTSAMLSRDGFIGTAMFQTACILKVIEKSECYGLVIDYAINILNPLVNKQDGFCLDTFDFFYRDHADTVSKTKKNQVFIQSIDLLKYIHQNSLFDKEKINQEIFQQSLVASWSASGWGNRLWWAANVLLLKPFNLFSYWNLAKALARMR